MNLDPEIYRKIVEANAPILKGIFNEEGFDPRTAQRQASMVDQELHGETDWGSVAKSHWDAQPHPSAPSVPIGEYATAVKLATKTKFGGHASPQEAELFHHEFKQMGIAPQDYEQALDRLAPLSFTYHGRPPTMAEIAQHKDSDPKAARSYYAELPDKQYPHVPAGAMVKALQSANPHFDEHLGRPATKLEAAYLHHSGEHPGEYALRLASDGAKDGARDDTGAGGTDAPGGRATDQ